MGYMEGSLQDREEKAKGMVIIGIDIGLDGAISQIVTDNGVINPHVWDTPTKKIKRIFKKGKKEIEKKVRIYDVPSIHQIFDGIWWMAHSMDQDIHVFIEEALIIRGNFTIKTNISLAKSEGIFEGVSWKYSKTVETVNPHIWQKVFGITGKKGDTGDQSIQIARSLFPTIEFETKRGRKLDGRADALLIAEYGRRTYEINS